MGLNKHNAMVFEGEMSSTNAGIWKVLDLGAFTGNKQAEVILDFLHSTYATDPTEWGTYYGKGLSDNVNPVVCTTVIGGAKGRMRILTDDDGIVEWKSDYGWPYSKRITLRIYIQNSLD